MGYSYNPKAAEALGRYQRKAAIKRTKGDIRQNRISKSHDMDDLKDKLEDQQQELNDYNRRTAHTKVNEMRNKTLGDYSTKAAVKELENRKQLLDRELEYNAHRKNLDMTHMETELDELKENIAKLTGTDTDFETDDDY